MRLIVLHVGTFDMAHMINVVNNRADHGGSVEVNAIQQRLQPAHVALAVAANESNALKTEQNTTSNNK